MKLLHATLAAGLILAGCHKTEQKHPLSTANQVVALLQETPDGHFVVDPDSPEVTTVRTSDKWIYVCEKGKKGEKVFADLNGDGLEDESGNPENGTNKLLSTLQRLNASKPYKQPDGQIPEAVWVGRDHVASPYTGEYICLSGYDTSAANTVLICPYSGKQFKISGARRSNLMIENQLGYLHPMSPENVRISKTLLDPTAEEEKLKGTIEFYIEQRKKEGAGEPGYIDPVEEQIQRLRREANLKK